MGLDVTLHYAKDVAKARAAEEAYQTAVDELWELVGGYDKATTDEKEAIRIESERLGRLHHVHQGDHESVREIILDSKIHPEHLFKIGYFRSSYNEGGINNVLERQGIPTLYDIFSPGDSYEFVPDWRQAKKMVTQVRAQLAALQASPAGRYDVTHVMLSNLTNSPSPITSTKEALALFEEQRKTAPPQMRAYNSAQGTFVLDGIKIFAVIPGQDYFGPCAYLIIESSEELIWHAQALEIVEETIDYVLGQADPENYYLSWSS